jgi:hypothetical protein
MMSRCWFLFFSLFAIKKEKEELKKSSCEKEAPQKSVHKRGAFVCKYERIDEFKLSSFF